ncbi:hypothetical protein GCM10023187_21310 [Nibrella viscosa]|uniref:Uncharacterized protein n=1 Tax=Nibrella viscosa TaxID=1084524 RepID=A0ABP8KEB2_9BACT
MASVCRWQSPDNAMVLRNYPNPVDGKTTVEFMLPQGSEYSLDNSAGNRFPPLPAESPES